MGFVWGVGFSVEVFIVVIGVFGDSEFWVLKDLKRKIFKIGKNYIWKNVFNYIFNFWE